MNTQSRGLIGWHPRDIPPPGSLSLFSQDPDGDLRIIEQIPSVFGTEMPSGEPIDVYLPVSIADGIREHARGIIRPGDSISTQISGGSVEHEIRVTISRLSDRSVSVVWGDVVSCKNPNLTETTADSLHQTAGDTPDMLSRHDDRMIFSSATPSSYSLLGYRPSELTGMSLLLHIHPDDRSRVESLYNPLITGPGVVRVRYRIKHRLGEYRWVESVFSSIFLSGGSFSVMMASTREMDAIVRAEQAARGANAKLNLLNGIIRHDMMNQITGMIGYLDILTEMSEDEDIRRLISKEQDIVSRIRRLIDLTRDYQGIGLNPPGFIDVDAVIYKILARAEIAGKVDPHRFLSGLFVYADRMFEQVILEMVTNSLVYGGEGVMIRFSYQVTDEGLVIVMEDNGPGIADHEKKHIFSRSYQNRRGYGLYLATEILDITGIRIRETGTLGKGARFEIVVPPDGYRLAPVV